VNEANERVLVATSNSGVTLPWESRQELLERLRGAESARWIVNEFEEVGTERPVNLTLDQKGVLIALIGEWMDDAGHLPEGIAELRDELLKDTHHAG
jgi:hypothetical protein